MEHSQAVLIPARPRRKVEPSSDVSMSANSHREQAPPLLPYQASPHSANRRMQRTLAHLGSGSTTECESMIKKLLDDQDPVDKIVRRRRVQKSRPPMVEHARTSFDSGAFRTFRATTPASLKSHFDVGVSIW